MNAAALFEEFAALESRLTAIDKSLEDLESRGERIDDQLAQLCWTLDWVIDALNLKKENA